MRLLITIVFPQSRRLLLPSPLPLRLLLLLPTLPLLLPKMLRRQRIR